MGKKYLDYKSDPVQRALAHLRKQNPQAVVKGKYLRKISCPSCGKNEAFAFADNPSVIICPRKKKCGVKTRVTILDSDPSPKGDINDWWKDGVKF